MLLASLLASSAHFSAGVSPAVPSPPGTNSPWLNGNADSPSKIAAFSVVKTMDGTLKRQIGKVDKHAGALFEQVSHFIRSFSPFLDHFP